MAKFYAVGYTNGGANEKRLGPFNNISDAWKSGQVEQGSTRRFSFAGVVDENGQYVSYNSRALNGVPMELRTAYRLRLKQDFSDEYGSYKKGQVFTVYQMGGFSPHHATLVAPGREVTLEVPWDKVELANSRACNSSNPVVQKAMNACAMG